MVVWSVRFVQFTCWIMLNMCAGSNVTHTVIHLVMETCIQCYWLYLSSQDLNYVCEYTNTCTSKRNCKTCKWVFHERSYIPKSDWAHDLQNSRLWNVHAYSYISLQSISVIQVSMYDYVFFFNAFQWNGPHQANLVLIAYASSEGSGEPAHPRSLARTFAARSYKQWVKRNLQTESQIPGPSEWLGMRSENLSWRNARRHKFAWRGSNIEISRWNQNR